MARRPDLQALSTRIAAEEASLGLTRMEYCPDVELMAAYDSIWQEEPLRPQVGLRVNLPVRLARRAELARQTDQANYEVQQAYEQVREGERTILPAARAEYTNAKVPFLTLVGARRNATGLQDRYYEAVADYRRRLAALERVAGGALTPEPGAGCGAPPRLAPRQWSGVGRAAVPE